MTPRNYNHPFEKYRWNRYGFEIGEELQWFEWLFNYKHSLREYRERLKRDRFDSDDIMDRYILVKEEIRQIQSIINQFASGNSCRPYHGKFLKSKKIDTAELLRFKNLLLKNYEISEKKDPAYYLSIVNNKLN